MPLLAIDPGNEESAYVLFDDDSGNRTIIEKGLVENPELIRRIDADCLRERADFLAIEMIASYGMPVGKTVFETALWIGRFIEHWGEIYRKIYRTDVKVHLCKTTSGVRDSNIRQAILDLYPMSGGGATPQVGIKNDKGPLYGVKKDIWAALGVALTASESRELDTPIRDARTEKSAGRALISIKKDASSQGPEEVLAGAGVPEEEG